MSSGTNQNDPRTNLIEDDTTKVSTSDSMQETQKQTAPQRDKTSFSQPHLPQYETNKERIKRGTKRIRTTRSTITTTANPNLFIGSSMEEQQLERLERASYVHECAGVFSFNAFIAARCLL